MKNILTLLAFICWHSLHAQEKKWSIQATTFSTPDDGYVIEPEVTFSLEDEFSFHEFSINSSGSLCTINGIIAGSNCPYIYLSYNPFNLSSYSSVGFSREVSFGSKFVATTYFEIGIDNAEFKNWSLGIGMIYSVEIPKIKLKNKKRGP